MKLAHVTSVYGWVLNQALGARAKKWTYRKQLAKLFSLRFAWSDVWKFSLGPMGYEVEEIILNSSVLQKAWAREHQYEYNESNWKLDIVCAQLKKFQPDVVFLDDYAVFSANELRQVRSAATSIRLLVGWCGAPYGPNTAFREFDLVLSNIPSLSAELTQQGCSSEVLRHAFDARINPELPSVSSTAKRITFCGTISQKKGWHEDRARYLEELAKRVPIKICSDLARSAGQLHKYAAKFALIPGFPSVLRSSAERLLSKHRQFPSPHLLRSLSNARAGLPMYQLLAGSTATFNMHIGKSSNEASNMRLFEATGVGACLLTDRCGNLRELFEPEYEVVTYAGFEECVEKAQWLLENPEMARQIGLQGRKRVLAEHTFDHRAAEFDAILKKHLSSVPSQIN